MTLMRIWILSSLLLLMPTLAQAVCYGNQARAETPLTFSPVPQLPVPTLFARWVPVLDAIGKSAGQCFELVIKPSIPEFEKYLLQGSPTLAYANPYHAVMAHKAAGYKPIIADGSTLLTGILTVKRDSDIRNLSDLENQRVAFPAPNAFAASLLLRAHLQQLKINIKPQYVKTHSNVYRSVIIGDAAAGGGVNKTLENEPEDIQQKLRVLYESPGYRSHPVVVSPKLSSELRERLQQSFITLAKIEEGRKLLAGVQLNDPIIVTYQKDYAPLEKMGLEKLVTQDE